MVILLFKALITLAILTHNNEDPSIFKLPFFATYNIGGAKELVVLLLNGDIWYKQWAKRVGYPLELDKMTFCYNYIFKCCLI